MDVLFPKVFKNIYLFRKILSYCSFDDELVNENFGWLVENNYLVYVEYKLINNLHDIRDVYFLLNYSELFNLTIKYFDNLDFGQHHYDNFVKSLTIVPANVTTRIIYDLKYKLFEDVYDRLDLQPCHFKNIITRNFIKILIRKQYHYSDEQIVTILDIYSHQIKQDDIMRECKLSSYNRKIAANGNNEEIINDKEDYQNWSDWLDRDLIYIRNNFITSYMNEEIYKKTYLYYRLLALCPIKEYILPNISTSVIEYLNIEQINQCLIYKDKLTTKQITCLQERLECL